MEKIQNKKTLHGIILGAGTAVSASLGALVAKLSSSVPKIQPAVDISQIASTEDIISLGIGEEYVKNCMDKTWEGLEKAKELFGYQYDLNAEMPYQDWADFGAEMSNTNNKEGFQFFLDHSVKIEDESIREAMMANGYQQVSDTSFVQGSVSQTVDPAQINDAAQGILQTGLEPWQNGVVGGLISAAVLVGIPATIFAVQKHKINKLSKEIEQEK